MIPVDGLWIDMNEPSNFCNGECKGIMEATKVFIKNSTKPLSTTRVQTLTDPPYYINNQGNKAVLNTKTVDPDAVQSGTTHYNAHNLFGRLVVYTPSTVSPDNPQSTLYLHVLCCRCGFGMAHTKY